MARRPVFAFYIPGIFQAASIDECIEGRAAVPQWYIMTDGGRIIAGAGVIANDFHDRKDLTPNVCALYVEPELRCRGIAGQLLAHICKDMAAKGIGTSRHCRTTLGTYLQGYGGERHRHALPRHGTHLVLRTIRLEIPVYGAGRRRGTDADVYITAHPFFDEH